MEDSFLDISQDKLIFKETQHRDSSATFSKNLMDHFGIIGHIIQTGFETINPTENVTNDEVSPSTSDIVSSWDTAIEVIEHHLTVSLHQTLKEKSQVSAKCDFLCSCLACNFFPDELH